MPILNYSTVVPPERSVSEITALLVRKGARSITSEYSEAGQLRGVSFVMVVGGIPVRFELPANVAGVAAAMLREKPYSNRVKASPGAYKEKIAKQAEWTAWRILKDWVEAQLALIESGQAEAAQVFMPFATHNDGRTMYQCFVENNQRQIAAKSEG